MRKVLANNANSVSKTARILAISRNTVRRARDGSLEDISRCPHTSPNKTEYSLETLIVEESKRTGFRYKHLASYMYGKYGIKISQNTIKAILKRNMESHRYSNKGKIYSLFL